MFASVWLINVTILCLFLALPLGIIDALEKPDENDLVVLNEACGSKLASKLVEYSKFHAEVLSHQQSQRYLISVAFEAGLADRITGLISHFWLAFFCKRAFQIGSFLNRVPSFEYAYDYRFINWTRPPDPSEYTANLLWTYRGIYGYSGDRSYNSSLVDTEEFFPDYLLNEDTHAREIYQYTNLSEYPHKSKAHPVRHTVFTSSNRGGIRFMFENNYMTDKLKELGIEKYTAFRCAFNFLFKYNAETLRISEPFLQSMKRHHNNNDLNSSLIIGIAVRVGDHSFDPTKDDSSASDAAFSGAVRCAKEIEQSFYGQNSSMAEVGTSLKPWYVMADSLHVRRMIASKYHNKVVIDSNTTYFHGDCVAARHSCDEKYLRHSITHAASDIRLFSMCNVHIASYNSRFSPTGFSRVGAFLSKPPFRLYMNRRACSYDKSESIDIVINSGAGIRL